MQTSLNKANKMRRSEPLISAYFEINVLRSRFRGLKRSAKNLYMNIRTARQEDARGIAAVVHAMSELRSVSQQSIEATTKTVSSNLERLSSSGCSTAYIAEESQGEIVGYGAVHWTPFLFLLGGEAYVTELFVRPSASDKGVGSGILETIIAEAKQRGCSRVSLLNGRDGESYQRSFYKKRGWVERDRMANFIFQITKEPEQFAAGNRP